MEGSDVLFIVICDECEQGYGCNEFSWVKNSKEDGELFCTKEEATESAENYIVNSPFSFTVIEETKNDE